MKRVAVFGKPGSGKSTFSKKLARNTGIKLHALDSLEWNSDGTRISFEVYQQNHKKILSSESWVIDGFGPIDSFYERLNEADTLVYIDLPYWTSYWLVTKRLLKGLFIKPEGWPDGSSVLKGTLRGYKVLRLCPKFWNQDFLNKLESLSNEKNLYVIKSLSELKALLSELYPQSRK